MYKQGTEVGWPLCFFYLRSLITASITSIYFWGRLNALSNKIIEEEASPKKVGTREKCKETENPNARLFDNLLREDKKLSTARKPHKNPNFLYFFNN